MEHTLATYDRLGVVREREGNRLRNSAPLDNWETSDGKYVCIIAAGDGLFPRLARAMGREDLLADPRFETMARRAEHGDEINGIVADWVQAAHVARGRRTSSSAHEVPVRRRVLGRRHLRRSARRRRAATSRRSTTRCIGPVRMQGVYPRFSRTPGAIRRGAPTARRSTTTRCTAGCSGSRAAELERAPRAARHLIARRCHRDASSGRTVDSLGDYGDRRIGARAAREENRRAIMNGLAKVSVDTGVVFLPVETPYDQDVLFEYLQTIASAHRQVEVRTRAAASRGERERRSPPSLRGLRSVDVARCGAVRDRSAQRMWPLRSRARARRRTRGRATGGEEQHGDDAPDGGDASEPGDHLRL